MVRINFRNILYDHLTVAQSDCCFDSCPTNVNSLTGFFLFSTMSDSEHEEGNDTTSPPTRFAYGRHEKSLGLLTSRFVQLLQNAEGGVLDLRKVRDSPTLCT